MKKIVNNNINYNTILVLDEDGSNLGIKTKSEAIKLAEEKSLDLLFMNYNDKEKCAVCKICNASKVIYDIERKKKKPTAVKQKDITLRIHIDPKDLERKCKDISRMIEEGCKVKVSMYLKKKDMKTHDESKIKAIAKLKEVLHSPYLDGLVNIEHDRTDDLFIILSKIKVKNEKVNT
jgi:translation initiation factor IF-3